MPCSCRPSRSSPGSEAIRCSGGRQRRGGTSERSRPEGSNRAGGNSHEHPRHLVLLSRRRGGAARGRPARRRRGGGALLAPEARLPVPAHHLPPAASAFFCAPFEDAAVTPVDGVGEWAPATMGVARGGELTLTRELRFPHSLGLLYSVFTAFLGFEVNEGEYKVMGMAPFGEPRYVDQIRSIMELREDGSLWLDPAYMRFHDTERAFTRRFERVCCAPRPSKRSTCSRPPATLAAPSGRRSTRTTCSWADRGRS